MSILDTINMPHVFDLEDGEIWQDDEFVQTEFVHVPEQVSEVQDCMTNTENNGHHQKYVRDEQKQPDFTRVQPYHKKMYRYQYQNPNWNGVTRKKCRGGTSSKRHPQLEIVRSR